MACNNESTYMSLWDLAHSISTRGQHDCINLFAEATKIFARACYSSNLIINLLILYVFKLRVAGRDLSEFEPGGLSEFEPGHCSIRTKRHLVASYTYEKLIQQFLMH
ncbi:hypothetical protein HELRODRAFT_176524 [Helobdella robusta]|uniref:Uncharacterized protein n=1 Tax=Helobdella robusta TaxID=6412 RepID=T1FAM1_HELRO|nr:hypothetical protein HELRODRAFT_176524 [Helobdella robusta]ESN99762.1 hypothetical protein HELRODRAFT_176524 [Helobdella robusta]